MRYSHESRIHDSGDVRHTGSGHHTWPPTGIHAGRSGDTLWSY
ncbi:hypothetical protein MTBBW1_2180017 [Desulfamplus magnetovallimortis]|uniref:Uncharacterized protein n=1 Tax=Desulfamplus magnetovallimortis TaxID=1246637 RepID=A0A1W1HCS7_9BACT|nr:hypothetical protein MTBBW1_2180017 [Desulfamplus magnetovallimortis]